MKSYHKQLWELLQDKSWTHLKLDRQEVGELLKEYQELKAKISHPQEKDAKTEKTPCTIS